MEQFQSTLEKSPRQRLLELEQTGLYLFHGSGEDVEELEPRQAIDTIRGKDGDPAVFASDKADYAIFMAIISRKNAPKGLHSKSGSIVHDDGAIELVFKVTKDTWDQIPDSAEGYVYVFDKKIGWIHRDGSGVEYMNHTHARPLQVVRVTKKDLPSNIEIYE